MVVLQSISFANYALTTKTTNIIYGSAPYLTFDGGRTRVTNTEALLGISLSDGRKFTPATSNSRDNPIVLPVAGQSFNDIGMLVPTDTDSIALSSLIGTPYNYWGDDDGDGQGIDGITATGSLNLSIVDKGNNRVARNEVLTICKAPYKLTLSNTEGRLTTRYGVPNESHFSASNATYYINPKAAPAVCGITPSLLRGYPFDQGEWRKGLSTDVFNYDSFRPQSFTPSSYGLNFPTTGANNLYFYLDIGGSNQALSWAPVSHGGITATMTDSTRTSVRVTLKGPVARKSKTNPGGVNKPSLPQSFELVGRDSSGNAVVKYGFVLKQWFISYYHVNSLTTDVPFADVSSWCYRTGYRLPKVRDLTNASSCSRSCGGRYGNGYINEFPGGATPSSPDTYLRRHIGGGLFSEWGRMGDYLDSNFGGYLTSRAYYSGELTNDGTHVFSVVSPEGQTNAILRSSTTPGYNSFLCTYP
ncbi:hypothetical protein A9G15_02200 [Gilliamella apis]|nr:hypothetical protein A9G15_02200 [Gilliamella apis]